MFLKNLLIKGLWENSFGADHSESMQLSKQALKKTIIGILGDNVDSLGKQA